MKFILVLALIAVAYGEKLNCWKSYTATDSSDYFLQGGWFNGTDQNGHLWYFSTCTETQTESLCLPTKEGDYVSVCQEIKGITYAKGTFESMQFSDSPYGADQGVEIMYGYGNIKTVVELVCSEDADSITVKNADETTTVITYNSQDNCPNTPMVLDMQEASPQVEYSEERTIVIPGAFVYFFFLCTSLLCVCCCCTCIMRRRRCQQRKDIQMKQFSSVAFQPIPANTSAAKTTTTAPQASFNPYVSQPQFVYYYPSQNGNVQEFPFAPYTQPSNVETQNDEAMARNLQAQFDQEHV